MSIEERTFLMIKPDAVQRNLIGEIISRIEHKGLRIVGMKFLQVTPELAAKHYEVHKERPFYNGLVKFITSSPALAIVAQGKSAVSVGRLLVGSTNPVEASPGTIRGDYGLDIGRNMVHASDSVENAKYEASVYFNDNDLIDWSPVSDEWVYE
ncbi:MAG: nucleoside-diphosphate kinase [Candidatus Heimdallarchaeota archaeon]|nr:nucleoside-diphosphate kinase [Candidatus Heimdallarchaeota archaeon]